MTKPKLIYICGMGHCGSTIVDLALCASPGVVSAAQLNDLYIDYDPLKIADAEANQRDRFWQEIILQLSESERELLKQMNRSVSKEKPIVPMFFSARRREQFADINAKLARLILEKTDGRLLVDSSKNVSRCLALTACDSVDVYVLHLIRDVRGLVNSANKRRKERSQSSRYLIPTMHWMFKNTTSSLLVPRRTQRILKMRYEDFVAAPGESVARLEAFVGENLEETRRALEGETDIDPERSYGFGGNRVLHNRKKLRFRSGQFDNGGVFDSNLYWFTLGWMSRFWGYRRKTQYQ